MLTVAHFLYLAAAVIAGLAGWLLYRFWLERRFRRLAYVAPAESSWAARQPNLASPVRYRLALVGDLGAVATDGPDPVLSLLQHWLEAAGEASGVVLLGDNVYPTGIPAPTHPGRAAAERRDRKSTRLNSSHSTLSRMPSSA